jgi:hypothetical protein
MGKCLKKAYSDIQHFEVLESFANFRDAVKSLLNTAAGTPGIQLLTLVLNFWAITRRKKTDFNSLSCA